MPTLTRVLGSCSQAVWKTRPYCPVVRCVFALPTRRTISSTRPRLEVKQQPASEEKQQPGSEENQTSAPKRKRKSAVKKKQQPKLEEQQQLEIPANSIDIKVKGKTYPISPVWLRDSCPCSACVDPSTRQKNFATVDIPADITGRITGYDDAGSVTIEWANDIPGSPTGHATTLPHDTLVNLFHPPARETGILRKKWTDAEFRESTSDIPYQDYMQDDAVLWTALHQLRTYGLMFLTGVPQDESAIIRVAERIGPLKNTFYGLTWDVRSVPEAKNVAYTSGDLGFHMDLMYVKDPPALQLLHCIRSSAKGGASQFTDIYAAALELLQENRTAFLTLAELPVRYHYDHPEHHYERQRPVIETVSHLSVLGKEKTLKVLSRPSTTFAWSPPFQAPMEKSVSDSTQRSRDIEKWHLAAQKLNAILHRPSQVHERMLGSGDLVIFDNRRTLHARTAFEVGDAGVERWLKGCYIDGDVWDSKVDTMGRKFNTQMSSQEQESSEEQEPSEQQ